MYDEFYGFTEKPFTIVPNPTLLYPSRKHKMALTYLEYGLLEGTGFIVLTGEIGTGKTTLIRHLLSKIDDSLEAAVLFNTNVGPEDLLRLILQEFEIETAGNDKSANLDRLNDFLIDKYAEGRRCLLIIDEAQNLSRDSLEEVRMLSNLQTETAPLIQIAMVGQPELRDKLRDPTLEQLKQRVTVSYHLGVMTRHETGEYIVHRLNKAGAGSPYLFTEEAIDLVYQKSGGVPRTINILCDAALVYGFADEAESISLEIVEQVIADREDESEALADEIAAPSEAKTGPSGLGEFFEHRLSALESRVGKLQAMLDMHETEINERMESSKDRLVHELEKLFQEERDRSQRLTEELAEARSRRCCDTADPEQSDLEHGQDGIPEDTEQDMEWLDRLESKKPFREETEKGKSKKSRFRWLGLSRDKE